MEGKWQKEVGAYECEERRGEHGDHCIVVQGDHIEHLL